MVAERHLAPAAAQALAQPFVSAQLADRRPQRGRVAPRDHASPALGLTWYNGSKGAAIILTKSMAAELAPQNIRVCAINPVIGETGMLEQFMGMKDTPENRAKFLATIPLGRFSKPADIANAALFLASPDASMITGVALEVDGGRCM